jgi:3-deoxy-manno-octulosonate cytidylyltransferase (CMP-KDO synthetase)
MNIIAVIPARLASSRFPRKVLYPFNGIPMVEHVRRRALLSKAVNDVFVATPDEELADIIKGFGGKVIMTSLSHLNGTTRVAEAVASIECSHVLLLQGDEPLLLPRHLDLFTQEITANPKGDAWNATSLIEEVDELDRKSFVKCSVSESGKVLFCFRRSPYCSSIDIQRSFVHKMLGIIAFKKEFLLKLTSIKPSSIEIAESIEQLRIIENGYHLQSILVSPSIPSVNEPHEVDIVFEAFQRNQEQQVLLNRIISNF